MVVRPREHHHWCGGWVRDQRTTDGGTPHAPRRVVESGSRLAPAVRARERDANGEAGEPSPFTSSPFGDTYTTRSPSSLAVTVSRTHTHTHAHTHTHTHTPTPTWSLRHTYVSPLRGRDPTGTQVQAIMQFLRPRPVLRMLLRRAVVQHHGNAKLGRTLASYSGGRAGGTMFPHTPTTATTTTTHHAVRGMTG